MNKGENRKQRRKFLVLTVLGITALVITCLLLFYAVVSTTVRNVIYESVLDIALLEKQQYVSEIDVWLNSTFSTVQTLADTLTALSTPQPHRDWGFRDYDHRDRDFIEIAERIVRENEHIINVFIGFSDGSIINGSGIRPGYGRMVPGGGLPEPHGTEPPSKLVRALLL